MRKAISVLVVILTTFLFPAPAIQAGPSEAIICSHIVQPGETIYCIARAYGVDPWAIAVQNGLVNPNLIHPGQVLEIPDSYWTFSPGSTCAAQCPPASPACSCSGYHTVVTGENLYRISLHYGVDMWHVARCNGIYNPNYIRIADALCIPAP